MPLALDCEGFPIAQGDGLWKQAQPGGRKRSGHAVSGEQDALRERPATGHGEPRAAEPRSSSGLEASGLFPLSGRAEAKLRRGREYPAGSGPPVPPC